MSSFDICDHTHLIQAVLDEDQSILGPLLEWDPAETALVADGLAVLPLPLALACKQILDSWAGLGGPERVAALLALTAALSSAVDQWP